MEQPDALAEAMKAHIRPLMAQVEQLAKEHGIAFVAGFDADANGYWMATWSNFTADCSSELKCAAYELGIRTEE